MKVITIIGAILIACFSTNIAYASWVSFFKYSKFEDGMTYIMQTNTSNEEKDVTLDLYPNAQGVKVLVLRGFPNNPSITTYLFPKPGDYVAFTNFRIRIGKQIFTLKTDPSVTDSQTGKWFVVLAVDNERNSNLIGLVESSINKGEEIALEFPKTGSVYTFKGNTLKKFVDGK